MEENIAVPGSVEVELGEFRVIPGPRGETGERGPRGYGIESAVMNPNYTLTLKFEDGSSYTVGPIRGADGTGISKIELEPGLNYGASPYDTLKVTLSDGKIEVFRIYNAAAASANAAKREADRADSEADRAETARQAIENLSVTAKSLKPGEDATVTKTQLEGFVNLLFGIPRGEQGAVGPQGEQGVEGPPGPRGEPGINGVAVAAEGQYAFNVEADGHLWLYYTGDKAPDLSLGENGHLYLNFAA